MSETLKITVLQESRDAEAERWGDDIIVRLSHTVPPCARDAARAYLVSSLEDARGDLSTVHLERGQAVEVAQAYSRPVPRARPCIRINPLRTVTVLVVPFVVALFAVSAPWVLSSSVKAPAPDPLIAPPVETRVIPVEPPPVSPRREPAPPSKTQDRPRGSLPPRIPMPTIVHQIPAQFPDMPVMPTMPSAPSRAPSYPARRPSREPGSMHWLPSAPWDPWSRSGS